MSGASYAIRLGLGRGWSLFRHTVTTADGVLNTVVWNGLPLAFLVLNRDTVIEGTDVPMAVFALPGFLGLLVGMAAIGPAYYIAAEREDGTLLRAKAVPNGIVGYLTGVLALACLETLLGIALILGPGMLLFPGLVIDDPVRWLIFLAVVGLGLLATLPAGVVVGSVVKSPRVIGGIGFLVVGGMAFISGIVVPLEQLPGPVQVIAQALPTYWIGHGLRFVFLPDAAVALEIGESWRHLEMLLVLGAWAVAGSLSAPALLRRMARRQSGATVEAGRLEALQRL